MTKTIAKELLESPELVIIPSAYDCVSAKAAELCGFKAAMLSGSALSMGINAIPDIGTNTLDEVIWVTEHITQTATQPLIIDLQEGFGKPLNAYFGIKRLLRYGILGVMISDKGARCNGLSGDRLELSDYERVARIRAAAIALEDSDCLLIAEVGMSPGENFEEAVSRAKHYRELGADVILPSGLLSCGKDTREHLEMLKKFHEATPEIQKWYVMDPETPYEAGMDEIYACGYKFISVDYSARMSALFMLHAGNYLYENGTNVIVSKMRDRFPKASSKFRGASEHFGIRDKSLVNLETRIWGEDYPDLNKMSAHLIYNPYHARYPDPEPESAE